MCGDGTRTNENAARTSGGISVFGNYLRHFSQGWFATPQDVLHADWQEVWHSPQPPSFVLLTISLVSIVLIRFIVMISYLYETDIVFVIIPRSALPVKYFRRGSTPPYRRALHEPWAVSLRRLFAGEVQWRVAGCPDVLCLPAASGVLTFCSAPDRHRCGPCPRWDALTFCSCQGASGALKICAALDRRQ